MSTISFADEVISGFTDTDLTVLNEELRQLRNGVRTSQRLTLPLDEIYGGTGKSSWTQYLIPYADTTTSFSQIAIGSSGQVLTSNGAGAAPSFQTPTAPGMVKVSTTTFSSEWTKTISGLSSGKRYKLTFNLATVSGTGQLRLTFNGDGSNYGDRLIVADAGGVASPVADTNYIAVLYDTPNEAGSPMWGEILIQTNPSDSHNVLVTINAGLYYAATRLVRIFTSVAGYWGSADLSSMTIQGVDSGHTMSGTVTLYELT